MKDIWQKLKTRQRRERAQWDDNASLRIHRALSWLERAAQEDTDADARFLFLWIAFNSAYANDIDDRQQYSERTLLLKFLQRLCQGDTEQRLYELVWHQFPGPIRLLLNNPYVFQPFWDYHRGRMDESDWQARFKTSQQRAKMALAKQDTPAVLAEVIDRLYTLRNQLVHGGATWNSSTNREQMKDACKMMEHLVPVIIELMMASAHEGWGQPCYPVVDQP